MKLQIFHEDKDKIYYANPYHHENRDTDASDKKKVSFHRLTEPYCQEETNSFNTKAYFIRYAEELVVLRDIIKFRSEIKV